MQPEPSPRAERPYVVLSCAISVDGCLDAPGPERLVLSGAADLDRVDGERARADAIMVGAGTIRRDDPRLLIRAPERQAAQAAAGLPEHPAGVTITASGDLDPGARFFHGPAGLQRLVYCPAPLAPRLDNMLNGHAQIIPVEVRPDFSVAPSTGGRRAEMLGAITRASRGLPDAARLARLETEQLTRETLGWSSTFEDQLGLTASRLAEMATLLTATRQRHVIAWLQEQSSASARAIGDFLASLAAHADAPARIDSHAWQARHDALRPSVATFASEFGTAQLSSGKLP